MCRRRLCPVSSPLMWLVHDPKAGAKQLAVVGALPTAMLITDAKLIQ